MDDTPGTISFNMAGLNSRMLEVDMLKISRVTLTVWFCMWGFRVLESCRVKKIKKIKNKK